MSTVASPQSLQQDLALWRRRYAHREAELTAAHHNQDAAEIHKWGTLLAEAVREIHALEGQVAHAAGAGSPPHVDWMPGAEHRPRPAAGDHVAGYAPKCLWHTTDGNSDATGTLDSNRDWPNFELLEDGHIIQYMPVSVASRSLKHPGGFPETNLGGPCQIEVVGLESGKWPAAQVAAAARLARFIEANHGVERACHVSFHPVDGVRLGATAWQQLRGHCGHMHVPSNDHTDPGPIDVTGVMKAILG